jgi:GNAT superfamily N-acetyltransferase
MAAGSLELRRTTSRDPAFVALVRELDVELWQRYGELQAAYEVHTQVVADTAVLACADEVAIGCGCFRPYDASTIELKRMFVAAAHRGAGVGRAIVQALEAWARELGYTAAVLETGVLQPEAVALYTACGYTGIPSYGPYVGMATSICMGKQL